MAQVTQLQATGTPGRVRSFTAKGAAPAPAAPNRYYNKIGNMIYSGIRQGSSRTANRIGRFK